MSYYAECEPGRMYKSRLGFAFRETSGLIAEVGQVHRNPFVAAYYITNIIIDYPSMLLLNYAISFDELKKVRSKPEFQ
ncbi:MAG: hypothetical protein V1836_00200 [Candidatus Aenigmatarchaeota archaeon]